MTRRSGTAEDEDRFVPFADDVAVRSVGALAFENGTRRITVHGSLELTRDKAGLAQARALRATLDAIVRTLRAQDDLPEAVPEESDAPARSVANPFA